MTADRASTIAVIPARGGSKRIPGKNIRPFLGVPLLARTIGCLQDSGLFDRIVVSTDCADVASVALGSGAEVPFTRPAGLAGDHAPTAPVISHAVEQLEIRGSQAESICLVYPTAVLVTVEDLATSLATYRQRDCDFVFAATSFAYPPQRALRWRADGFCTMVDPSLELTRSQDLEPVFHDAGQFCWGDRQAWLEQRPVLTSRSIMHLLPPHRVQDIDTMEDWRRAELLYTLMTDAQNAPA